MTNVRYLRRKNRRGQPRGLAIGDEGFARRLDGDAHLLGLGSDGGARTAAGCPVQEPACSYPAATRFASVQSIVPVLLRENLPLNVPESEPLALASGAPALSPLVQFTGAELVWPAGRAVGSVAAIEVQRHGGFRAHSSRHCT